jgi:hypothetical protein
MTAITRVTIINVLVANISGSRHSNSFTRIPVRAEKKAAGAGGIHQHKNTPRKPTCPVAFYVFGDLEPKYGRSRVVRILPLRIYGRRRTHLIKIQYPYFDPETIEPCITVIHRVVTHAIGQQNEIGNFIEGCATRNAKSAPIMRLKSISNAPEREYCTLIYKSAM